MNAWPALETLVSDGWVLRFSDGYTRRANSVHSLFHGTRRLAAKIDEAERLYRERGLATVFKLTPDSQPRGLEAELMARGYAPEARTSVQVADLVPQTAGTSINIVTSWDGSTEWRDAFHRMGSVAPERRAVHDRILASISLPTAFASVEENGLIAGCALGVIQGEWLGIFDVTVDGGARRRGHGERLMRGLMAWGRDAGAEKVYLQVMLGNMPALALYDKLGFREAYQYWYRVLRFDGRAQHASDAVHLHAEATGGRGAAPVASCDERDEDYGFSYQATRNGEVLIRRLGQIVMRLRHDAARSFLGDLEGAEEADAQETMARYTGNYKRGNERTAREHPRRGGRPRGSA